MTATMGVNAGQTVLQELQQGVRARRVFHMEVSKAKFLFTLFVLIFSIADCVLPLAFSHGCYYEYYYNDCWSHNYILIYIGVPTSVVIGLVFMLTVHPGVALCIVYLVLQVLAAILILISNIYFIVDYAYIGQLIGAVIINICYFVLLLLEIKVVSVVIRQRKSERRLGRIGQEIRVIAQAAPMRPPPPQHVTVAPPTSGAPGGPVTTTTVITTYNAAPEQPVIIPPGIPAVHGIPPGPLNPATLANNQVYARTTSNMYPPVPQVQQMIPVTTVTTPVQMTTFATAPASANMLPSAPPQLYDVPPEVTVATVYHQNKANDEEQYDMPPALAEDQEESIHGRSESPSPSDFSVPSSSQQYYEAPPAEVPQPVPRKTRPSDIHDAPNVDQYEAPPSDEDETPIFL